MDKLTLHSPDLTQRNLDALAELFPSVMTESRDADGNIVRAVDFDLLRQELADHVVEGSQERYQLDWPGKRAAMFAANAPIAKTLRPAREESVDFDTTRNLFIEGDNLEALKLLQESYLGKVKLIYIDPPYNTGSDFVYNDDFAQTTAEYLAKSGQVDEQGNRLVANTEANGRFHSDWLDMIYPRLKLARSLLREDGFIFVSIGNSEQRNLRAIMDELFGEANFVESIIWNKRVPKNDKGIGNIHEYIVVYRRSVMDRSLSVSKDGIEEVRELVNRVRTTEVPVVEANKQLRELYRSGRFPRAITLYNALDSNYRVYGKINLSWPNGNSTGPRYEVLHPVTGRPVAIPDRGWRWIEETFRDRLGEGEVETLPDGTYRVGQIWFDKSETTQPSSVQYLDQLEEMLLKSIISLKSDGGIEVEELLGSNIFPYPKPVKLLNTFISAATFSDSIVVDFFAGSATTAHAVMALNAEDGGNRQFILVQYPEATPEGSTARNAGYATIADIAKERIRRAGKKIKDEAGADASDLDIGFRALRIDSTNLADVRRTPGDIQQSQLALFTDSVTEGRSGEDLLFEVLLNWGLELTLPMHTETLDGKQVLTAGDNDIIACFDDRVTPEVVRAIAERQPLRAVFRDSGFASDAERINAEQIFREVSPVTEVKAI